MGVAGQRKVRERWEWEESEKGKEKWWEITGKDRGQEEVVKRERDIMYLVCLTL